MQAKYPLAMRVTHWLVAAIVIGLLYVGLTMTDMPKGPDRQALYDLHKSFGVVALLLFFLRVGVRSASEVPPLPPIIPAFERRLALLAHYALYFFTFTMPLSGYLMSNAFGLPVKCFGIAMPQLMSADRGLGHMLGNYHHFAGLTLIVLIMLHVGGVAKHYLKERVNLLQRMV